MFQQSQQTQQQQGVSELLLGVDTSSSSSNRTGGNGSDVAIGSVNGYGNSISSEADRNISATLDLNDFPSLGGASGGGGANGNSLQNQLYLAHQQMLQSSGGNGNVGIPGVSVGVGPSKTSNLYRLAMSSNPGNGAAANAASNFNMTSEDFPALPGALPPAAGVSSLLGGSGLLDAVQTPSVPNSSSSVGSTGNQGNSLADGMYNLNLESNLPGSNQHGQDRREPGLLGGTQVLGSLAAMQSSNSTSASQSQPNSNTHQQRSNSSNSTSNSNSATQQSTTAAGSALTGDYGLLGLLGVIRMSDADRNALALGSDLTSLGLNLNSPDQLYSTFASPWSDSPTTREPQYQLPMCYYMQPPALKTGHLSKFHLETLFYIFYALPKDVLQAYAAQELYAREWRYNVELKLWFKRATPANPSSNNAATTQYMYFDINTWERHLFTGNVHQKLTSGALSEEDVRVKFPNS